MSLSPPSFERGSLYNLCQQGQHQDAASPPSPKPRAKQNLLRKNTQLSNTAPRTPRDTHTDTPCRERCLGSPVAQPDAATPAPAGTEAQSTQSAQLPRAGTPHRKPRRHANLPAPAERTRTARTQLPAQHSALSRRPPGRRGLSTHTLTAVGLQRGRGTAQGSLGVGVLEHSPAAGPQERRVATREKQDPAGLHGVTLTPLIGRLAQHVPEDAANRERLWDGGGPGLVLGW